MRVTDIKDTQSRPRRVALGEFDGVHVGHRRVIAGADTVLSFEPHPRTVLRPELRLPLLSTPESKVRKIAALGVQELVVVPFTAEFANVSAERFIDELLVGKLHVTEVSVGADFHFGQGARGQTELLAADTRFTTRVVELVEIDGERVSSSRIRALLAAGDVARAGTLLGEPFTLAGEVVVGDRRGRELGFPTANIVPDPTLACPGAGVYAGFVAGHMAAINVGVRPTFGDDLALLVESYLLDFSGDLYGVPLEVQFIARIREEERFETVQDLIDAMHCDVVKTRELLGCFPA